jgi:predicted nicotinamide N-methyase
MEQQQGKLSGTRVLEVGCGLALPSLVAARMGAHVVATDYLAEIGALLQQNIALNGSCDIVYELCDYRTPPYPTWSSFDFILASEVTYEQCYFAPLIAFLKQVAGPATTIYLADPLRTHHAALISCIEESGQFAVSHYDRLMGPPEQQAVCRILCLRKKEGL